MLSIQAQATKNVGDSVRDALCLTPSESALVVYDLDCPLARTLAEAYRQALPQAQFIDFNTVPPEQIMAAMFARAAGDLVVLVQSANFRLNEFRIRIELFKKGLKTIEHTHLNRIPPEEEAIYIAALAYDREYYLKLGHGLKNRLDTCAKAFVRSEGSELTYATGMEPAKLNIGDYTQMKNVGGTFPIGEVFTEAKELTAVNGTVMIFAFAGEDHLVQVVTPFRLRIEAGRLVDWTGAPAAFAETMEIVRAHEEIHVREFGLGLNRAMDKTHTVRDITAFERMNGMHMSLGAKHPIYAKEGFSRKEGRYHIDVFVDAQEIRLDDEVIFRDGSYVV